MSEKKDGIVLNFEDFKRMIIKDTSIKKSPLKYTPLQIRAFLDNPQSSERHLRNLSRYLYDISHSYKKVVNYYAQLGLFHYTLEPYDFDPTKLGEQVEKDKLLKQYMKACQASEKMNIADEMLQAAKIAWREDVVYGYEHEDKNSYFIQYLNPDFCKITSIQDGCYNFAFDFDYFKTSEEDLIYYPPEFHNKYYLYKGSNNKDLRWQELNNNKTICLKINRETTTPIPPFSAVFEDIFDLRDYKALDKAKAENDNFGVLIQKIPMGDKENQYLIDQDMIDMMHDMAGAATPDSIGALTTMMETQMLKLQGNSSNEDLTGKSQKQFYDTLGTSQMLFNGGTSSSVGLNKSIMVDEQDVYGLISQVQRWHNRKLKNLKGTYKFRANYLKMTSNNQSELQSQYLKNAQYGINVVDKLAASLELAPSSLVTGSFFQNEVLKLHETLIPLKSSHTGGDTDSKEGAGRNAKSDNEASEETIRARDNESNINRQED